MNYSIVIATRNRAKALRYSIPRMLTQSRKPAQLIVVDSSDDHVSVEQIVRELVANHSVRLTIINSERGLTLQRNVGLAKVTEPIVFFPDDDSILLGGAAESIMTVYEQDTSNSIAAVCAAESSVPPPDFANVSLAYAMSKGDRMKQRLVALRTRIENRLFPDPARILGQSFFSKDALPSWFREQDVVQVESMTGFRMTFRTSAIRATGFDENLKRYAQYEDRDASFSAWRTGGLVVAARRAKIYHYRSPERRDFGRTMGVVKFLNLAYVIAKHTPCNHRARAVLRRFCYYKTALYFLSAHNKYGRDRFRGSLAGMAELKAVIRSEPDTVLLKYQEAMARCLVS